MKIGFTGTQHGLTTRQIAMLSMNLLRVRRENMSEPLEFHHGDCVGGDAQFHEVVAALFPRHLEVDSFKIIIHPPKNPSKRAWCQSKYILPEEEYLVRNRHIADDSFRLMAAPATPHEVLRSGTWATVRYGLEIGVKVIILQP